jgi:hypothetical protein
MDFDRVLGSDDIGSEDDLGRAAHRGLHGAKLDLAAGAPDILDLESAANATLLR